MNKNHGKYESMDESVKLMNQRNRKVNRMTHKLMNMTK